MSRINDFVIKSKKSRKRGYPLLRDFYFQTTKSLILLIFHNFLRKTFYIIDVLMRRISLSHPEEKFIHQFPQNMEGVWPATPLFKK